MKLDEWTKLVEKNETQQKRMRRKRTDRGCVLPKVESLSGVCHKSQASMQRESQAGEEQGSCQGMGDELR